MLVSLPKKWVDEYNVKKGDEINVDPGIGILTLSVDSKPIIERAEFNLSDYGIMAPRVIFALYKKGIDEIKIHFHKPMDFKIIQESLQNKTIGFEIVEQANNYCVIKNVSGQPEDFEVVLRRIFLLLMTMSSEGITAIKNKDKDTIANLRHLEETNNRLTQVCRRYINKIGKVNYPKLGPLYYLVEQLEKIADEFKYLFAYIEKQDKDRLRLSPDFFSIHTDVDKMIKSFYNVFYKFDANAINALGMTRKDVISRCLKLMENSKNPSEVIATHHILIITEKIFDMIGPYLVIAPALVTDRK